MARALGCFVLAAALLPAAASSAPRPWTITIDRFTLTFDYGQCTYWAARERPDVPRVALERGVHGNWDARGWVAIARRAGFPISRDPTAGALVVWQPGVDGAGPLGHVAYVRTVGSGGEFTVTEMDWNGNAAPTSRTIRPDGRAVFIGRLSTGSKRAGR